MLVTVAVPMTAIPSTSAQMSTSDDCTPHSRIRIVSDAMFKLGPAVGVVNPAAAGTADDPYVIEGWCIIPTAPGTIEKRSQGAVADAAISIEGTSAHVVVRDNQIDPHRGAVDTAVDQGIAGVESVVGDLAFLNNPPVDQEVAVNLYRADNVRIENNVIDGNPATGTLGSAKQVHTVAVDESTGVSIENNTITDNGYNGVGVVSSKDVAIANNTLTGNGQNAVYVFRSDGVSMTYNNLAGNGQNQIYGVGHTGLEVEDSGLVDATHNWWSNENGPGGSIQDACTGVSADGGGEIISRSKADVCFDPWLTEPSPFAGAN